MQIIPKNKVEIEKWNQLVARSEVGPYDYSWYLDAVSENWYLYIDAQYTKGFAFSTQKRLGLESVTVAPFVRENNLYGNWSTTDVERALTALKARFKSGIFQSAFPLVGKARSYQVVTELQLAKHAERNIRKAKKSGFHIEKSENIEPAFSIMVEELEHKIPDFGKEKQALLRAALLALQTNNQLITRVIMQSEEVLGGLFFFKGMHRTLYIKGGANQKGKKQGGMYLAMAEQIKETTAGGRLFDFDGSEVPGVKRFNEYFNTVDKAYYQVSWDHSPWWYRLARKLYQKIKSTS